MSRVAYAILCHGSLQFLRDQFEILYSSRAWYFYHVDPKAHRSVREYIERLALVFPNIVSIPSGHCAWGGFSLTDAMLRLVHAALARAPWDHLVFLTEQHLPLQSQEAISASLEPGTNYVECRKVHSLPELGQADIHSRFNRKYIEVPGVGGFATTRYTRDQAFFAELYHGSQCMTLSRQTCEALPAASSSCFDRFRFSVLSDEIALQTWVYGTEQGRRSHSENRNLTFVATPSRGGSTDAVFDDDVLVKARQSGYLFIRKRPASLTPMMNDWFFGLREATPQALTRSGLEPVLVSSSGVADLAVDLILSLLNGLAPAELQIERVRPDVHGPALFGSIRHPDLRYPFAVYLLSQDLLNYKVVSVFQQPFEDFVDGMISHYETSVLRMRAHSLSFHREIHIGNDCCHGLMTVGRKADFEDLMVLVRTYVERTLVLASWHSSRGEM